VILLVIGVFFLFEGIEGGPQGAVANGSLISTQVLYTRAGVSRANEGQEAGGRESNRELGCRVTYRGAGDPN
jgi:hypothetical protein